VTAYEKAHPSAHAVHRHGGGGSRYLALGFGHVTSRAHVDAAREEAARREREAAAANKLWLEQLAVRLAAHARLPIETARRRVAAVAVTAQPMDGLP
jgi:hypothetical protein